MALAADPVDHMQHCSKADCQICATKSAAQQHGRLLTCVLELMLGMALPVAGRPAVLPRTCCCRCCWALSCWACCSCWAGSRAAAPLASPAACSHQCSANQDRSNTASLKLSCHLQYSFSQDQSVPPPPSLPPCPSKSQ